MAKQKPLERMTVDQLRREQQSISEQRTALKVRALEIQAHLDARAEREAVHRLVRSVPKEQLLEALGIPGGEEFGKVGG